ncbi:hypothetical protein [Brevibacterium yomogidense]|uniref:Type II secretion system protein E n=1 Tax=Brevibacterium yomogidense TaxID=946573 RepID=A0A1X6X4P4_9MICO|nr:hypothetical protein [Brevibacterium yomogidense]SLM94031.1 type II secretion system protein E [Brevibacterium yomogidense]
MLTESGIAELIERLLCTTGRRDDLSSPLIDAALPECSCLHIMLPDITDSHPPVNVRKFIARIPSPHDVVEAGSLTPAAAGSLDAAVVDDANILVTGQTQASTPTWALRLQ